MQSFSPDSFFSLIAYPHRQLWGINSPVWEALTNLKKYLSSLPLGKIEIDVSDNVFLENKQQISIGKGTVIEPGAMIQGPCVIGKNCIIRHGAYLRSHLLIGDGCVIGHSAELKHSILFDHAAANHFVYVGDSIIGSYANLGAGLKCSNLRLDRQEVCVRFENKKWKTGLKKLGAIVGDKVQVGCNCVINPGTLIGKESVTFPLLNIGGYIPPRSCVKGERSLEIVPVQAPT